MDMVLGFDFGNTFKKYAIFQDGSILEKGILTSFDKKETEEILLKFSINQIILSSVIQIPSEYLAYLQSQPNFHLLGKESKSNLALTAYQKTHLGLDRLALCEGAIAMNPGEFQFVICLGSCITYNLINPQNEFLGGVISPGLNMKSKSMHDFTALLPHIPPQHWDKIMGTDTEGNLLSGLVYGSAFEIEGYIRWAKKNYPGIKIYLTGGDAQFILDKINLENILFEPDLLWHGLVELGKIN